MTEIVCLLIQLIVFYSLRRISLAWFFLCFVWKNYEIDKLHRRWILTYSIAYWNQLNCMYSLWCIFASFSMRRQFLFHFGFRLFSSTNENEKESWEKCIDSIQYPWYVVVVVDKAFCRLLGISRIDCCLSIS